MNLYRVDVEYTVYVRAKHHLEAQEIAVGYDVSHSDTFEMEATAIAVQVHSSEHVSDDWLHSIPFGHGKDMTVGQILEAEAASGAVG